MATSMSASAAAGATGKLRSAKVAKIPEDVADVLRRSATDGRVLRLPTGQLDRALYASVDKVLKAMGGKWDRRAGGHVFPHEVADELAEALENGGAVDRKKTLEQFFTPPEIAERLSQAVGLRAHDHVLEPSAGEGALLERPLQLGCFITAVELDERLAMKLRDRLLRTCGCGVWQSDFEAWEPVARAPISVVLMNPPFSRGQDARHVMRAFDFLAPGGRLAAVMGDHAFAATDAASSNFRRWLDEVGGDAEPLPEASFKASGTRVGTRLVFIRKDDE